MAVSDLNLPKEQKWSEKLDRRLGWMPFDWRLLAPFFLLGTTAGMAVFLWFLVIVAGQGG